jgi:drug/metabolite transporter (DMT)-like permease
MTTFYYIVTVLIWGSTWLAIYFQLGETPVVVSVTYRFAIAAILLLPVMKLLGRLQKTRLQDQGFMVLQGACLFSFNFICFYNATLYISSGLVSVIFSLATLYNAINNRVFYHEKLPGKVLIAALFGVGGLVVLFWPELQLGNSVETLKGVLLAALGTLLFSFGNMISKRHSRVGIAPITTNAYGMTYGAIILLGVLLLLQQPFVFPEAPLYWGALLYLSVFGSIVAFTTYLILVARIGANRAAYATVLFPVVALALSAQFEGYQFTVHSLVGIGLTLIGNVVINSQGTGWKRLFRREFAS